MFSILSVLGYYIIFVAEYSNFKLQPKPQKKKNNLKI